MGLGGKGFYILVKKHQEETPELHCLYHQNIRVIGMASTTPSHPKVSFRSKYAWASRSFGKVILPTGHVTGMETVVLFLTVVLMGKSTWLETSSIHKTPLILLTQQILSEICYLALGKPLKPCLRSPGKLELIVSLQCLRCTSEKHRRTVSESGFSIDFLLLCTNGSCTGSTRDTKHEI